MRVIYLTTHKKMLDHTDQEYANLHNNEIQFRTFTLEKWSSLVKGEGGAV